MVVKKNGGNESPNELNMFLNQELFISVMTYILSAF